MAVAARCTRQEQRVARTSKSLSQKRRVCTTHFHHGADINANFTPCRTEARKIGCAWDYLWREARAGARGLSISRNADMWHMAGLASRSSASAGQTMACSLLEMNSCISGGSDLARSLPILKWET